MKRKFKDYVIGGICILIAVGGLLYMFWTPITGIVLSVLGDRQAEINKTILEDRFKKGTNDSKSKTESNDRNRAEFGSGEAIDLENASVTFDYDQVEPINERSVLKAIRAEIPSSGGIGMISVPDVGISIPIFQGLNNGLLLYGAGTMKANQVMGERNFALCGHTYDDRHDLLFGPLHRASIGQYVYLTNFERVYYYKIMDIRVLQPVDEDFVSDSDESKEYPTVTLITCESGGAQRLMVQADLIKSEKVTTSNKQYFI